MAFVTWPSTDPVSPVEEPLLIFFFSHFFSPPASHPRPQSLLPLHLTLRDAFPIFLLPGEFGLYLFGATFLTIHARSGHYLLHLLARFSHSSVTGAPSPSSASCRPRPPSSLVSSSCLTWTIQSGLYSIRKVFALFPVHMPTHELDWCVAFLAGMRVSRTGSPKARSFSFFLLFRRLRDPERRLSYLSQRHSSRLPLQSELSPPQN